MSNAVTSPDFITIVTNVGVLLAAIGTVIAAIWKAVKTIKASMPEEQTGAKIVGGSILDTPTMLVFLESNRDLAAAIREHTKETMELRFAVKSLKETWDG